jgi:hypothetical protein
MASQDLETQRLALDERRVVVEERKTALEERRARSEDRFFRRHFATLATALVSLAAIVFSVVQWHVSTRRAAADARQALERADRDYDMETYKVVIASVSSKDSAQQYAALSLVARMNDSTLRDALRDALKRGGTAQVRAAAAETQRQEQQFKREEATLAVRRPSSKWRYDVFYCENSGPEAEYLADSIAARLKDEAVVRTRALAPWINASPGYRVSGLEVRFEASEQQQASTLLDGLNRSSLMGGRQFSSRVVSNTTPNYLSVFVCP